MNPLANDIQFDVMVFPVDVEAKEIIHVYVLVIHAVHPDMFIEPKIFNAELHAHVTLFVSVGCGQSIVKSRQLAVAVIVTV